ncbi:PTS IIA-like nitrogen regulatory protein PtsN [Oceanomicrobium pacificus]|uniref:PTS IIA-like nitrogen regulatory protein PtsN n=1 Tax=Oceanomicrobium pacificus TaxID=2692916 RepID=A0A6B0TLC5_9RHOB|nr:PTS IIA-like nitrogen regulatory protein PtsN [Oceanomicrobium pacificus]MXU64686.1 PTS IIA-like nitrogen regulatory protein PtsN [Oceanomicrobium pacificus]
MELTTIVSPDAIHPHLKATSKKRLLQELAEIASERYGLCEKTVCAALMERETLGPTGMGHGVAIPHARIPDLDRVVGVFARLDKPVDFDSVDRQPVDLVFALFAPQHAGADHLKALARVSRTLRDADIRIKLRSTDDAGALFAILTEPQASQAA